MDICDKISSSSVNAKEGLKVIIKRINHPDPHVTMQAITLLDACVNNCGKTFHLEIASREFEQEFRRILTKSQAPILTVSLHYLNTDISCINHYLSLEIEVVLEKVGRGRF
jgi:signal transducing adaptor molecule